MPTILESKIFINLICSTIHVAPDLSRVYLSVPSSLGIDLNGFQNLCKFVRDALNDKNYLYGPTGHDYNQKPSQPIKEASWEQLRILDAESAKNSMSAEDLQQHLRDHLYVSLTRIAVKEASGVVTDVTVEIAKSQEWTFAEFPDAEDYINVENDDKLTSNQKESHGRERKLSVI